MIVNEQSGLATGIFGKGCCGGNTGAVVKALSGLGSVIAGLGSQADVDNCNKAFPNNALMNPNPCNSLLASIAITTPVDANLTLAQNSLFIQGLYNQYLNRAPTSGELSYWAGMMANGTTQAQVQADFDAMKAANTATATVIATSPVTGGSTINVAGVSLPVPAGLMTWLSADMIPNIPNWLLAIAGAAGLFYFVEKRG